jgi:hypothetical protein
MGHADEVQMGHDQEVVGGMSCCGCDIEIAGKDFRHVGQPLTTPKQVSLGAGMAAMMVRACPDMSSELPAVAILYAHGEVNVLLEPDFPQTATDGMRLKAETGIMDDEKLIEVYVVIKERFKRDVATGDLARDYRGWWHHIDTE